MERETMAWWDQTGMIAKYLRRNQAAEKRFSFIDGPITANNPMGVHHAWGRTYKDLYQRYKTMQGFKQRYQNGFDGQGLWIEVEVERDLGFNSKRDIEAFGVDRFVELCKERVRKFAGIQTEQSIRMGYWMDWDNSYHTMDDENNYTIWHFLKRCHDQGWVYQGRDVMPWCARCGTGLSEHEIVTEGYREIVHPGVFVRFPLTERPGESLLIWTTTPWTLSSNVAAAVHPELTYVKVRQPRADRGQGDETLILAKGRLASLRGDHQILEEFPGKALEGMAYTGPFDELPAQAEVEHRVVPWDEVSEAEGTGIVHIAPGSGKEDFALGKEHGLATIAPLDEFGSFIAGFGFLEGLNVAEVNTPIFESLRGKGLLYHVEEYPHRYPVCWRCDTELVFRLVDEWFISMDTLRHQIADVTRRIRWIPSFGMERELDWLRNMDDWMISKKRYWGLALPIYKCESCGHFDVIGSETELQERAVEGWDEFQGHSPHRPWIDAVKVRCPQCGATVSRIRDVGNPWLDAGIVPYSTLRYRDDRNYWQEWFPADWVSESFPGQFRNWFYSLLTMSTALENQEPFRTVFSYALMRDEQGEEMHKSKGNAIWFEDAADQMGVDAMRWLYARCNPTTNLSFGPGTADEVRRRFIIPLWNVYSFFVTYANIDGFDPTLRPAQDSTATRAEEPASELDRWVLSELNRLVADVTAALEEYDSSEAARRAEEFVEGLSNWYVRRSRRRFWKSESDQDKAAAYNTLYECLTTLTKLLAPFIPFFAEELYQNLVRSVDQTAPESVHLADWPVSNAGRIDETLQQVTALVMQVASLGRAARSKAKVKVRQPLAKVEVKVRADDETEPLESAIQQVLEELNVKELVGVTHASEVDLGWFTYEVKPRMDLLGPKYGSAAGGIASALAAQDPVQVARAVAGGATVQAAGQELLPEEVEVRMSDPPGWISASDGDYVVRISTELTPGLEQEGLARELVHRIQNMRRSAGFDIEDRIVTSYETEEEAVRRVFVADTFGDYSISAETLSARLEETPPPDGAYTETQHLDGMEVTLAVRRVG